MVTVRYIIVPIVYTKIETYLRLGELGERELDCLKCDLPYCGLRYHPFLDLGWDKKIVYHTLTPTSLLLVFTHLKVVYISSGSADHLQNNQTTEKCHF